MAKVIYQGEETRLIYSGEGGQSQLAGWKETFLLFHKKTVLGEYNPVSSIFSLSEKKIPKNWISPG